METYIKGVCCMCGLKKVYIHFTGQESNACRDCLDSIPF